MLGPHVPDLRALELLVEQLRHDDPAVRRLTFVCPVRPGGSVAPPRLRAAAVPAG